MDQRAIIGSGSHCIQSAQDAGVAPAAGGVPAAFGKIHGPQVPPAEAPEPAGSKVRATIGQAIRRLRFNHFARSASTLAGASLLAHAVTVLAAPILTRLYTPEDFGVYALFSACLMVAVIVATGQYELALALPARRRTVASLLVGAGALAGCLAAVFAATLPILAEPFSNLIGTASLAPYLWLLPVGLCLAAIAKLLRHLCIRDRDYATVAKSTFLQSLTVTTLQLVLGLWLASAYGLIGASVAASTVVLAYLARESLGGMMGDLARPSWAEVRAAMRAYRRFPLLGAPGALLNNLATSIVPILLAATHGLAVAGVYELSARIVQRSFSLLGVSVHQVYWGEASKKLREDPPALRRLFFGLLVRLFLVALIPTLLLAAFAPPLIGLVFGDAWYEAGELVRVMAPLLLARVTIVPLTPLQLLGRQDLMLGLSALRLVLAVATLVGGSYAGLGAVQTVAIYAAASALSYLVQLGLWISVLRLTIRARATVATEAT